MRLLPKFKKHHRALDCLLVAVHLFLFNTDVHCATVLQAPEDIDELRRAEKTAVERYPDLAVSNSTFNQTFLAAVKVVREKKPEFFSQPDWPLRLSDAVASDLKVKPIFLLDSSPIRESVEDARAHHALERFCVQVVKGALQNHEVHGGVKDWIEGGEGIRAARIEDALTLAAAQSDEHFDGILHEFLGEVLSSSAMHACAENREWIEGVLWTRSSWRCIEKYAEHKQCGIVSRLLAKCGNSKLVIDWTRCSGSGFARALGSASFLTESQLAANKPPEYRLRAAICSQIIESNYRIGGTVVQKRGFLTAANNAKIWSIYKMVPVSDWGLIDKWEVLGKTSAGIIREEEGNLFPIMKHFQRAIELRLKSKDKDS